MATALAYLGTPYIWGGDDPSGFDCSGFVLECLKSAGLVGEHDDFSADALYHKYLQKRVESPREGILLLSLDSKGCAFHVVLCLDEHFQIGASGGTSRTTGPSAARRDNAYIKIRPIRLNGAASVLVDPFVAKK